MHGFAHLVWVALAPWLTMSAGCESVPSSLAEGEACLRTLQCAPGLACVASRCTTDLGPLAEAGVPVVPDSGPPDGGPEEDGGSADAGPTPDGGPPADGGAVPDGGATPDGGVQSDGGAMMDAGAPPEDAGSGPDGGGLPDAGPPPDGG